MNFLSLLLFFLEEGVIEQLLPLVPDRMEKMHAIVCEALCGAITQQEAVARLQQEHEALRAARAGAQGEEAARLDVTIALVAFLQALVPALPPPPVVVEETELEEATELLLTILHGMRTLRDAHAPASERYAGGDQANTHRPALGRWLAHLGAELAQWEVSL
jgi:hypothetical protein